MSSRVDHNFPYAKLELFARYAAFLVLIPVVVLSVPMWWSLGHMDARFRHGMSVELALAGLMMLALGLAAANILVFGLLRCIGIHLRAPIMNRDSGSRSRRNVKLRLGLEIGSALFWIIFLIIFAIIPYIDIPVNQSYKWPLSIQVSEIILVFLEAVLSITIATITAKSLLPAWGRRSYI